MAHSAECLALARELKIVWDSGDVYGSTMAAGFPICNEIAIRGDDVPASWNFNPGAFGPHHEEGDEYYVSVYETHTTETLIEFGNFLKRLYERCEAQGKDY